MAYSRLGYSPITSLCSDDFSMKTKIMNFLQQSNAYGFYFSGHGSRDTIAIQYPRGTCIWNLQRTTIASYGGNWKFVFLDACNTGTTTWASAFNITNNTPNRAYMGWSDTIIDKNATAFAQVFFQLLGSTPIYNEAKWARNELSNLTLPFYFCGDRDYVGKVN